MPTPDASLGVAVEGQFAYVASRREGVQIFDVLDPYHPMLVSSIDIDDHSSKVAISGSFLYVLLSGGLSVFDVSDHTLPQRVDFVPTGDHAYNLVALADHIYVADGEDGLYVFHNTLITSGGAQRPFPVEFTLSQNYPNPFNPSTTIRYGLPSRSYVTLTVFNTLGQQVATLVKGEMDVGYHEVTFDASYLASEVYLYRLTAGSYVETRKLLLVR